jgi:chemotaxis signal transduction protein
MGDRRFALRAEHVAELALPGRLQEFPHTTPMLSGVLLRRGKIVPVCDVAPVLVGPKAPARKFYLMAHTQERRDEWTAIPVAGECELVSGEAGRAAFDAPEYVTGVLTHGEEQIPVVDLEKLVAREVH